MTVLSDGTNLKFNPTQSLQEGFSATFTLQNGPERE